MSVTPASSATRDMAVFARSKTWYFMPLSTTPPISNPWTSRQSFMDPGCCSGKFILLTRSVARESIPPDKNIPARLCPFERRTAELIPVSIFSGLYVPSDQYSIKAITVFRPSRKPGHISVSNCILFSLKCMAGIIQPTRKAWGLQDMSLANSFSVSI